MLPDDVASGKLRREVIGVQLNRRGVRHSQTGGEPLWVVCRGDDEYMGEATAMARAL